VIQNPAKEDSKMQEIETKTEAQVAWILWEMFTDFSNLLWDRYEKQFLDFILKDQYPTQKTQKKFMADEIDDKFAL